jgi:hypothetical protein
MELFVLQNLLDKIQGCTFASIDAETEPSKGIHKVTTGIRVILFTNKKSSGYENMVKRRLIEAGKNPDNFVLGDLPWGQRLENSPLIENKGKFYLQCILLTEGTSKYYIGDREISGNGLGLRGRFPNQGLPPGDEVLVACYNIDSIKRIAVMGKEVFVSEDSGITQPPGTAK